MITTTRVGSPMRPGNTAEAITPIMVARTTGGQRITLSGRAARRTCCQETERSTSEAPISSSESAIQPGLAVIRACPARLRFRRESANATRPATAIASSTIQILRRWPRRASGWGSAPLAIGRGLARQAPGGGNGSAHSSCCTAAPLQT